jgi:two-component sensor histidine kinase
VFLGWKEALLVLVLSVTAGVFLFLPPGMHLLPVSWLLVGGMNIAVVAGLQALADELAAANERQRILFQELQHRVANTLQGVSATLERSKTRMRSAPDEAAKMLEDAAQRIAASADVHRRLNDPNLFRRGLESILRDAVATVIDSRAVSLAFEIEDLDLSFDQMSAVTMLVIELANNAQKHVFQHGRGTRFAVTLNGHPKNRAVLTVRDDGPSSGYSAETGLTEPKLGLGIVQGLVNQLGGVRSISIATGTLTVIEFPIGR